MENLISSFKEVVPFWIGIIAVFFSSACFNEHYKTHKFKKKW